MWVTICDWFVEGILCCLQIYFGCLCSVARGLEACVMCTCRFDGCWVCGSTRAVVGDVGCCDFRLVVCGGDLVFWAATSIDSRDAHMINECEIYYGVLCGGFRVQWMMVELLVSRWLMVVQLRFRSSVVVHATLMMAYEYKTLTHWFWMVIFYQLVLKNLHFFENSHSTIFK